MKNIAIKLEKIHFDKDIMEETNENQLEIFELFRNGLKDIEIITSN